MRGERLPVADTPRTDRAGRRDSRSPQGLALKLLRSAFFEGELARNAKTKRRVHLAVRDESLLQLRKKFPLSGESQRRAQDPSQKFPPSPVSVRLAVPRVPLKKLIKISLFNLRREPGIKSGLLPVLFHSNRQGGSFLKVNQRYRRPGPPDRFPSAAPGPSDSAGRCSRPSPCRCRRSRSSWPSTPSHTCRCPR